MRKFTKKKTKTNTNVTDCKTNMYEKGHLAGINVTGSHQIVPLSLSVVHPGWAYV